MTEAFILERYGLLVSRIKQSHPTSWDADSASISSPQAAWHAMVEKEEEENVYTVACLSATLYAQTLTMLLESVLHLGHCLACKYRPAGQVPAGSLPNQTRAE